LKEGLAVILREACALLLRTFARENGLSTLNATLDTEIDTRRSAVPGGRCVRAVPGDEDQTPCAIMQRANGRVGPVVPFDVELAPIAVATADELPVTRHKLRKLQFLGTPCVLGSQCLDESHFGSIAGKAEQCPNTDRSKKSNDRHKPEHRRTRRVGVLH